QTHVVAAGGNDIYTAKNADVNFKILVKAAYTDSDTPTGHAENVTSNGTAVITDVNRVGTVSISGTAVEGSTLTASVSDPDGNPSGSITYTWQHWVDTNGNGIVDG